MYQPHAEILPGVKWGKPEWVPSPAYWAAMANQVTEASHGFVSPSATLHEEVGFCLLGGYGVTAEMNHAFFEVLCDAGVFVPGARVPAAVIEGLLRSNAIVDGRPRRYRFPKQKAARIEVALRKIESAPPPVDNPVAFRNALLSIPGIGPKTASWIARNLLGTDEVAILDIHVIRAGKLMGLFHGETKLPRDYFDMERRFLDLCKIMGIKASLLDAIIWGEMRKLGRADV
jgi:thermostable 8-oxoguanine DNA glycosylase